MEKPIENYFIFATIFRIQLETEYLFKHEARVDIPELLNFFCSLSIGSKGKGKPDVFPQINVTEHQLNALLHISTLMTAFQSYSEGVIQKKFYENQKFFEFFSDFAEKHHAFLDAKYRDQDEKKAELKFKKLLEAANPHRTDHVYALQRILNEAYFKKLLKENQFNKKHPQ
jgi:hypothetical protein